MLRALFCTPQPARRSLYQNPLHFWAIIRAAAPPAPTLQPFSPRHQHNICTMWHKIYMWQENIYVADINICRTLHKIGTCPMFLLAKLNTLTGPPLSRVKMLKSLELQCVGKHHILVKEQNICWSFSVNSTSIFFDLLTCPFSFAVIGAFAQIMVFKILIHHNTSHKSK